MSTDSVKCELEKYGLTPNRALGQNFLASDTAAAAIAAPAVGFFCGLFYFTLRKPLRFFKNSCFKK